MLARSAARFVTLETAKLFEEAALAMQQATASHDVLGFLEADKALDEALALAADNAFAARLAAPLQTHSRRFWYRFHRETGLADSARHHVALIEAIVRHDEEAAAERAEPADGHAAQQRRDARRRGDRLNENGGPKPAIPKRFFRLAPEGFAETQR